MSTSIFAMGGATAAEQEQLLRAFDEDPRPFYEAMRAMGPVFQDPVAGMFHVTARAEIEAVLKNSAVFSSAANEPVLVPLFGTNMLVLDGPAHARLRGLVSASFTPAAIQAFADRLLVPTCDEILAGFRGRERVEFVWDFCIRYPLTVIARMLDVAIDDYAKFHRWYEDIVAALCEYPLVTEKQAVARRAVAELQAFLRPIVRERMKAPKPTDLIGHMALSELEGARLTEDEIVSFGAQLIWVGAETTQRAFATTLYGILSSGARDRVRADEGLLEAAIEEGFR